MLESITKEHASAWIGSVNFFLSCECIPIFIKLSSQRIGIKKAEERIVPLLLKSY
jgi:hypothetical protein